jgi:peroxiredoxin
VGWLAGLSAAQAVGIVVALAVLGVLAGQGSLLLNLLRQNGRLLMRVEALEEGLGGGTAASPNDGVAAQPSAGLTIGSPAPDFSLGLPTATPAPDFELSGLRGETLTLASLRASGKPVMLLFTDPNCGSCTAMLPEIRRWQKEHAEDLTISLVSRGTVAENRAKSTEQGLRGILIQQDGEVSEAYEVANTPSAVLVRSDGTIGSRVFEGPDAISALLEHTVGERSRTMPGTRAPQIELPDLNGETVSLRYFRGKRLVVLFWDPECQFCGEMLPDLRAWEDNDPEEAPMLLVVSTGSEEATRKMRLSSPVLLDAHLTAARAFGAPGTPSAVLIDEQGRVVSELAVGAPAVLALAP